MRTSKFKLVMEHLVSSLILLPARPNEAALLLRKAIEILENEQLLSRKLGCRYDA